MRTEQDNEPLADEIAPHLLGGNWHASHVTCHSFHFTDASGASIVIQIQYADKKAIASGIYPRDIDGGFMSPNNWGVLGYGTASPSIGFSLSKGAKAIAKDLNNRFIPEYLDLYQKCLVKKKNRQEAADLKRKACEQIIDSHAGLKHDLHFGEIRKDRFVNGYEENLDINGRVGIEDGKPVVSLKVKLKGLSVEQTNEILKLIRDHVNKGDLYDNE